MRFLGFDTSNYTTSMAIVDEESNIILNRQIPLQVREKERGLRQSDALFLHMKNLPALVENTSFHEIVAVGASVVPRSVEGSYMPVFLASRNYGLLVASALGVNFYTTSHQNGHILAALLGGVLKEKREFIAVQISGGTFEVLLVREQGASFETSILSSSSDITPGQLIDRVGVELGEAFPCGKAMDGFALCAKETYGFKPSLTEKGASFAGIETKIRRDYLNNNSFDKAILCRSIFELISACVCLLVKNEALRHPLVKDVLFAGGVCGSLCLREYISTSLSSSSLEAHFAPMGLSGDNAVGVAEYARLMYNKEKMQ